jgi:hypothetical protein
MRGASRQLPLQASHPQADGRDEARSDAEEARSSTHVDTALAAGCDWHDTRSRSTHVEARLLNTTGANALWPR